jgi:hypothetical protein
MLQSENPQIIWEKWRDPYGYDDLSDFNEQIKQQQETLIDENEDDYGNEKPNIDTFKYKIPFMFTPMGIIPYSENTASNKIFNFWTGHTNFNLSAKICDIIENTEGVETLDIFTRYRFRVSIGKAFIDSDTMRNINHNTYQFFLS